MRLKLDIDPDLVAMMQAEITAGEKAVTGAMREAGAGLKAAWRGQITGAGLGRRLANSIRNATYPKAGESLNATALVWSKAPVIIGAHNAGPLIRSRRVLAGDPDRGRRKIPARRAHHPGRMGKTDRVEAALHLSSARSEPAGGRRSAEHQGPRSGIALQNRARAGNRADLPAGAAGQAAQAAGSGTGCGTGGGWRAGEDRGEVGGAKIKQPLERL